MERHQHNDVDGTLPIVQTSFVTISLPGDWSADANRYGLFFTATRPCFVRSISEVHTTAGSDGGTVTLQVERLTGTTAPGSGTSLLLSAFDLKGVANTVQNTIKVIGQSGLRSGDRLALKKVGTLTAVAGVQVTVELAYLP